jgi:hypothetical protein
MVPCSTEGCMELTLRQAFDNDHVEAIMGKFGWVNPETNPICYGCFKNVWKGKDRYELVDDRGVRRCRILPIRLLNSW